MKKELLSKLPKDVQREGQLSSHEKLKPQDFEVKWQDKWLKEKIYQPDLKSASRRKPPFYNLMMFPYPSAEGLHVGNMYAFTGADIYGRFQRMKGNDVFEPIGLDGFGIHSENYAIKIGKHPKEQAKISQENFYRQLKSIGNGYAWENRVETYDPDYYKWTQWLFVQMFKNGLAYRKKSPVNFCPSCKTVLSDEQVVNKIKNQKSKIKSGQGKILEVMKEVSLNVCERCGTEVEKRLMEQWFFRITTYAERLLNNTYKESFKWPEKVKRGQRNWIGRSEGVEIEFKIQNSKFKINVFTTALDTIFGTTFMVLSPDHPFISTLTYPEQNKKDIERYIKEHSMQTKNKDKVRDKTGVFTGLYVVNPFNKKEIPIWIADYVLMDYGTGAIMAVPGHDERDYEFAKKYQLEIIPVLKPSHDIEDQVEMEKDGFWDYADIKTRYSGKAILFNSASYDGLTSIEAKRRLEKEIEAKKIGAKITTYKLRDWCVSRQRYWGAPIPMINCKKCGWVPVPEEQLPVELPDLDDWKPEGTGKGPLAKLKDWVKVKCPNCGGDSERETDVCDTFLDSSWYFLRYPSVNIENSKIQIPNSKQIQNTKSQKGESLELGALNLELPWNQEITREWLPVSQYIGGAEHTVLHLLYARFVTMALYDWKLLDFEEPFSSFYAHGLIIAEGAKMSKSRGNVIIPDEYIRAYGADTLRTYLMFLGPFDQGGDFRDTGISGMYRFLSRVWRLANQQFGNLTAKEKAEPLKRQMHRTIKVVTEDLEHLRYNTAIAHIMEYVNSLTDYPQNVSKEHIFGLILLLAPFAPHMTEEIYQKVKSQKLKVKSGEEELFDSIHLQPWPSYDPKYLVEDEVTIVIQVNGKMRDVIKVKSEKSKVKSEIEKLAHESEKIKKYLEGKTIKQTIFVPGKLINFVIS